MSTVRVRAQAKVNLLLRVLAREASGYHGIETVFHRLDLADTVTVRTDVDGSSLDCHGPAMPDGGLGPVEKNLAWRALELYRAATGWPAHAAIEIEKRIPVGGGLGGGSADAGAVLRALEAASPRKAGDALLRIGESLGADVPFLTAEAPCALAWSRGERMLALDALPVREVALVVPTFGIATADAYGWLAAERGQSFVPSAGLLTLADLTTWDGIAAAATNHFEQPVFARHPTLARMLDVLRAAGAAPARMSGSGSTLFGVFECAPDKPALVEALGYAGGARVIWTRTAESVERAEVIEG